MSISIEHEQLQEIYKNAPMSMVGSLAISIGMSSLFLGVVPSGLLGSWVSAMLLIMFFRYIVLLAFTKANKDHSIDVDKWIFIHQVGVFVTSVIWGAFSYLFAEYVLELDLSLVMMAIMFVLAGSAIASIGMVFRVYITFVFPMITMLSAQLLMSAKGGYASTGEAMLLLFGALFLSHTSYKYSKRSYGLIQKTEEVEHAQMAIIHSLGKAGDFKDSDTGLHLKRMSYSSYLLALAYGYSEVEARQVLLASPMHDIGKIGIPDKILLKEGELDSDEWEVMKTHTTIGAEILHDNDSPLMKVAATIAENHHEKWDGSGYPKGLAKERIPIEARIVSICDVFDALTSARPYKKAWSEEDALAHIKKESGTQFDPSLVELFFSISNKVIEYNDKSMKSLSPA